MSNSSPSGGNGDGSARVSTIVGLDTRRAVAVEGANHMPGEVRGRWPALADDWLGFGAEAATARSEFVALLVRNAKYKPLYRVFPNLGSTAQIPYDRVPVRVRNCFLRGKSLMTWNDFCETTVAELLSVRNAGVLSVSALLDLALVEAITLDIDGVDTDSSQHRTEDSKIRDDRVDTVPRSMLELRVGEVAQWATYRRSASTFGDIFALRPELVGLPDDVRPALESLLDLTLEVDPVPDLDPLSILSVLSEKAQEIFVRKKLAWDTVRTIANDLGVTDQAIRQSVQRSEAKLADALDSGAYRSLRWLVSDLRQSVGSAYPIDRLAEVDELAPWRWDTRRTGFLLWMAGPYIQRDAWLVTGGTRVSDLKNHIAGLCDIKHAPTVGDIVSDLSSRGIVERAGRALVDDPDRFRIIDGHVFAWGKTIVDKAVTVLSLLGRPATDQEILDNIGGDRALKTVRNRLLEDPFFVRTDRNHFALREWNLEEYSGISEEIAERIQRAGGVAVLEDVIHELLSTFTVSESSIRQYAAAHRFVMRDGFIWLRTDEEIEIPESNPLNVAGTYQPTPNRLRYVVEVTADTLRGSGRGLPRPIAVALGVTPGREQAYVSSDGKLLRLVWRMKAANGPHMGSLSCFCAREQVAVGDRLVLDFDTTGITVDVFVVTSAMSINEQVVRLTGIDDLDPQTALAKALGVHEGAVRDALRGRGEDALVDSLPECEVDPALKRVPDALADTLM